MLLCLSAISVMLFPDRKWVVILFLLLAMTYVFWIFGVLKKHMEIEKQLEQEKNEVGVQ